MSTRFFAEDPITAPTATLRGAEAHHLLHVMRASVGAELTLFDGHGSEFSARITHTTRTEVTCDILAEHAVNCERPAPLTLAVALPKGDRQKVLVEKLTELGVTRLIPLLTERSVADKSASGLDKLRRLVIEASKQCGRNVLMEIPQPRVWSEIVAEATAPVRLMAHPSGAADWEAAGPTETLAAVGPEGGWSDAEVALAVQHGWRCVGLGPRILRVETAAMCFAAKTT